MPLVYSGADELDPVTPTHERARKIKPQYVGGELVRVAGGRNQAEAELIQGILLEEGIPSILRRTRGFDVPDFLAAGPRDVMVPEAGYETARALLAGAELLAGEAEPGGGTLAAPPWRLLAWVMVAALVCAALVWVGSQATG